MAPSQTHSPHNAPESELLLVSGRDRAELLARIRECLALCDREPEASLSSLAFSFNTERSFQDIRLAAVAGSIADLQEKLNRALNRLTDPQCWRIHDVQGIYFSDKPLGLEGKLAALFPGEGAPYLGMIGDLPGRFPEVADVVSQCDAMARAEGNPPLSRFLSVPEDANVRAGLEQELGGLGNTMFSVLMADWALSEAFRVLGVEPEAVAGHSAGELAALWVSGSLVGELDLQELHRTMNLLESDERLETESVLLAVGASRETVTEVLTGIRRELGDSAAFFLAMDNCPHQTVAIGPPKAMERVTETLRDRKIMHEVLPFKRPYHTPLFEPQMGPLARMFDELKFQAPRVPLYSCTTGKPFPHEPEAIRELAMFHWIRPVEFSQMIRNMHDDGVRIFLEVGPRGNLTSFVNDILRGRDFLAIAADTPRRSTMTQLNHVLGQLFVHHVPLRLDALYPDQVSSLDRHEDAQGMTTQNLPSRRTGKGRSAVVNAYWNVMGEFLDLQHNTMRQFLHRRRSKNGSAARSQSASRETRPPNQVDLKETSVRSLRSESAAGGEPINHRLPLIGDIVHFAPGRQITARRILDLAEDVYGDHHTVGGREVSYVHPERNGQPVVPMTFSLEVMAEAATLLVPGMVVTAINNVQLARWLVFDEDFPHTIELTGRVIESGSQNAKLEMRIFDLGHVKSGELGPEHKRDLAAVGTVEMAERYPTSPRPHDFPLSGERPCRIPLDVLYKNLFHGKHFQGVMSLDRFGDEGIQGQVRVLPRAGLLRSNPEPEFVLDPVLMDVAMHPLAGWHLEQPDQSGRILLPYELGDIRFYGPRPAVDTEMTSRGRILHESSRRFTHCVELIGPNNRIWCTMDRLKYWRFYLPFGEFNFHGPKDDYFLSEKWPEAIPCSETDACLVGLLPPRDLQAPGMMLASARVTLSEEELRTFRRLELPDARKSEWLFGRMAAKDAVRILWRQRTGQRSVPADIEIVPNENGQPIASPLGRDRPPDYPQVSLAHAEGIVAALASIEQAPGIDLERIEPREESFEKAAFSQAERRRISASSLDRDETLTRFWCAKEAVSKALGQGFALGPQSLLVTAFDPADGSVTVELSPKLAKRLPAEFAQAAFDVKTIRKEGFIIASILLDAKPPCPEPMTTSSAKSPAS